MYISTEVEGYIEMAIRIVIDYAKENKLRYYRSDFPYVDDDRQLVSKQGFNFVFLDVGDDGMPYGVSLFLYFDNERCGKSLKRARERFYNYLHARVLDKGVCFNFTFNELDFLLLKDCSDSEDKIEKILAMISKLLALADFEKNPSEAEAIAASMKVQELLAKYNLDVTDITGEEKREPIEHVVADVSTGKKWKYMLSSVVGKSYCCRVYWIGAERIVFYGFKSDSLVARRVFMYLYNVGNRLARVYVKERTEQGEWSGEGLYNSFCAGFTKGIGNELQKNCTALMLVVPQKVSDSFDVLSKNFKKRDRAVSAFDMDAYNEGVVEGKRAINAQYIESNGA